MISQNCPKCGSNRIRRGYRPTPFWSKIIFRYNLLCDNCNWEFTGFAVPGTVTTKPTRKPKKHAFRNSDFEESAKKEFVSGNAAAEGNIFGVEESRIAGETLETEETEKDSSIFVAVDEKSNGYTTGKDSEKVKDSLDEKTEESTKSTKSKRVKKRIKLNL